MIEWLLYPFGVYVALWAASSATEQRLVAPNRVITGYLKRLAALRKPPDRLYDGEPTWDEIGRYRREWPLITFLTLFYISPALPLTPGWRTAAEFMWLLMAGLFAYIRGIRHPSGRLMYYLFGGMVLAALFWSAIIWMLVDSLRSDISIYWYATTFLYLACPIPARDTAAHSSAQAHNAH